MYITVDIVISINFKGVGRGGSDQGLLQKAALWPLILVITRTLVECDTITEIDTDTL